MNAHHAAPEKETPRSSNGLLPVWVRTLTVLTTLPAWIVVVIGYLYRGELPPAGIMAIPAGVIIACSGPDVVAGLVARRSDREE